MNEALMGLRTGTQVELKKTKASRVPIPECLAVNVESPVLMLKPWVDRVPKEQLPAHAQMNQKMAFT
jgi:hypothetical protein